MRREQPGTDGVRGPHGSFHPLQGHQAVPCPSWVEHLSPLLPFSGQRPHCVLGTGPQKAARSCLDLTPWKEAGVGGTERTELGASPGPEQLLPRAHWGRVGFGLWAQVTQARPLGRTAESVGYLYKLW